MTNQKKFLQNILSIQHLVLKHIVYLPTHLEYFRGGPQLPRLPVDERGKSQFLKVQAFGEANELQLVEFQIHNQRLYEAASTIQR